MTSSKGYVEEKFAEAGQDWNLKRLYMDLASAKGRKLTPVEKQYLRGLLCGYSPIEMSEQLCVTNDSVRNYLCRRLYRYIEELLIRQTHDRVKIKDWSWIANLLETAGYKLQPASGDTPSGSDTPSDTPLMSPLVLVDSGQKYDGVPDISTFYGRCEELTALQQLVTQERCRLVSVLGIAGIGKTTLAAQFAHTVQDQFRVVMWRSLYDKPTIDELLADLVQCLSGHPSASAPTHLDGQISKPISTLLVYLQRHRCLLILDGVQTILSSGDLAGQYQPGYEGYGDLFRRIGEESHQSCLMLTSSETPKEIARLESPTQPVRSLLLKGLGAAAKGILTEKGLLDQDAWDELIHLYRGNPLALKIVASTIQDLFGGRVGEFLKQDTLFLGDFNYFLYQQFKRLSELEKSVIHQLATLGPSVSLDQLRQKKQPHESWSEVLEVLESLGRRSLIEIRKSGDQTSVILQPIIIKYVLRHYA